ncbi:MAG: radical SAM protein, partial [Bacteroidetes bacterium]|nr:radical SAM protein [Bacteroidota bacterium]
MKKSENYQGFELGPIRPPSEASSLLLRITRNCPWNKCKFCGLYKGAKFSIRPVDHVIKDIDMIKQIIDEILKIKEQPGGGTTQDLVSLHRGRFESDPMVFHSALNWVHSGMQSIFLQDANTMVIKPDRLVEILEHIQKCFPQVERITTYARSHSIARISDENMTRIANAGLNRIHIGMESASDEVLDFIKKGVKKEKHIIAGQKVKQAGIELSEYFMPGLGGEKYSEANALETADAMNQINPNFIRLRTLAVVEGLPLFEDYQSGAFTKIGDVQMAEEILLFLENLTGISSTLKSDHILNLLQEVEGRFPDDKEKMKAPLQKFLDMESREQLVFIVGRRTGNFSKLEDMNHPQLLKNAEKLIETHQITSDNVDNFATKMMM